MQALDIHSAEEWNSLLFKLPRPHVLQTWEWGQSKMRNGWLPSGFVWRDQKGEPEAAVLILRRSLRLLPGLSISVLYAPKGPILDWNNLALVGRVLDDLQAYAKKSGAVFLKIDPDILLGTGPTGGPEEQPDDNGIVLQQALEKRQWRFSQDQIQFRNTVYLDLTRSEDELLAAMKQKTRYNIRLAKRKGVVVREARQDELSMLYKMYAGTGVRDGFVVREESYYLSLWKSFLAAELAHILVAEVKSNPVAAVVIFHFAGQAYYIFGMSTENHRELMPNYLLQWEAIQLSKRIGCYSYDFWGAPDVFDETDSMWGVYRFKEGFNGITARHIGAWDFVAKPLLYKLYTDTLPKILDLMRNRGKAANRKKVQDV